jgi:hypothetical protein
MTSKSGIAQPSVQKNPKTGRFEKVAKVAEEKAPVTTAEPRKVKETRSSSIAHRIAEEANETFELALSLERTFFSAGILKTKPLTEYYTENTEEAECCGDPVAPCPFYSALESIKERRKNIPLPRALTVVNADAQVAVGTLNYVLARALYALNGDISTAEGVEYNVSNNTEAYTGWSEAESMFNDATTTSRSMTSLISHLLFGRDTDNDEAPSEEPEAYGIISVSLHEHLNNVCDVLEVVNKHAEILLQLSDENLL